MTAMRDAYLTLLQGVGENPERDGLIDTPNRAAKALAFLTHGYQLNIDDVINGAYRYDAPNVGAAYVVFDRSEGLPTELDVNALDGTNGFKVQGVAEDDSAGRSVAGAGDVNGDGIDDIIIGADSADVNENAGAGKAYVIYGQDTPSAPALALSSLDGTEGFING